MLRDHISRPYKGTDKLDFSKDRLLTEISSARNSGVSPVKQARAAIGRCWKRCRWPSVITVIQEVCSYTGERGLKSAASAYHASWLTYLGLAKLTLSGSSHGACTPINLFPP
jgi:hypothetical protein